MENIGAELIQLFKAHRAFLSSKLADINLYQGQEGLIYHLSLEDGQTMTELIQKLQIQHSTLFKMTERMAKEGLLKKGKDKIDKRTSRLYLTEKGREKVVQLETIWRLTETELSKSFSTRERKLLVKSINKLINNLKGK